MEEREILTEYIKKHYPDIEETIEIRDKIKHTLSFQAHLLDKRCEELLKSIVEMYRCKNYVKDIKNTR